MSLIDQTFRLAKDASGLGLTCDQEGCSLAGIPLLDRTPSGFAPRAADEIAALMKSAYGQANNSNTLSAGLGVIAKALNQGDLGRAMVAALQLRLPELSWCGAAQLTKAHFTLAKGGYDPNEPRDERGRWTTNGASPSAQSQTYRESRLDSTPVIQPERPTNSQYSLKPILISSNDGHDSNIIPPANDNTQSVPSAVISYALTRMRISNARDPDYQSKVEECTAMWEKCNGLIKLGERFLKRQDYCRWPDGTSAIIRFGVIVPVSHGGPF